MNEQPRSPEEITAMYNERWKSAAENADLVIKAMYPEIDDDQRAARVEGIGVMLQKMVDETELKVVVSGGKRTIELPDAETPAGGMDLDEFVRSIGEDDTHYYVYGKPDDTFRERLERATGKEIRILDLDEDSVEKEAA